MICGRNVNLGKRTMKPLEKNMELIRMSEESSDFDEQIRKENQKYRDLKEGIIECCFCGTNKWALIRLYQGWCCISCFKDLLEGWDGKNVKSN